MRDNGLRIFSRESRVLKKSGLEKITGGVFSMQNPEPVRYRADSFFEEWQGNTHNRAQAFFKLMKGRRVNFEIIPTCS